MNKQVIKQEIENLKAVISEQQEQVLGYDGKIPQIEFDILMGNFRKVYELFSELNKMVAPVKTELPLRETLFPEMLIATKVASEIYEEPKIFNATVPVVEIIENKTEETITHALAEKSANGSAHMQPELLVSVVETNYQEIKKEIVDETSLPQPAVVTERIKEFVKPSSKTSATASLFDVPPTIAGQFQGTKTVREKIAGANEDKSIGEKLQQHPVSDLKKSIGINEKFSFINELFDGDSESYNAAIDQLNKSVSISEAMEILSTGLAQKHNWTASGESYQQLKKLVERRFTV